MSKIGRISGQLLESNLLRDSNLNFKNTTSDATILNINVVNQKIGVNTETPTVLLDINDNIKTTNLTSTYANIDNISIQYILNNGSPVGNEIVSNIGDLIIKSNDVINVSNLKTLDISIQDNSILTNSDNTNLKIQPNGTGNLNVGNESNETELNVHGSLHSTGNVLSGANLVFGNDNTDSIDFNSEINSNLIPDQNDVYSIGNSVSSWNNLQSQFASINKIDVKDLEVGNLDLAKEQGNIFYVSSLGSDLNKGDHLNSPFKTIKHALEVVDSSSLGPVAVYIFPGIYQEEFPLVVPEYVSIIGNNNSNTIVKPTEETQTNDAFLLNQNCTIENITITDFYSPGYAFKFSNNISILERSPFIKDVNVETKGSVTSNDDPNGFDISDAGKGAFIDGSNLVESTDSTSIVFFNVKFITPGVNCVEMTNGVVVEFINCFIYFANIGLHAFSNRIDLNAGNSVIESITDTYDAGNSLTESTEIIDGGNIDSGIKNEIRSVGSSNSYGNFGAVADGSNNLMYLNRHNFNNIGSGKLTVNDPTYTITSQELVELNQGRLYNTSTDNNEIFSFGETFNLNFDSETVLFNTDRINILNVQNFKIYDGSNTTHIYGNSIDLENINIGQNKINSKNNDLTFESASDNFELSNNKSIKVPSGLTSQRTLEENDLRYNTETQAFEGYSNVKIRFSGIYSENQNTSVTANNSLNDIVFKVNNLEVARFSGDNINYNDSSIGQYGNIEFNSIYNENISLYNNTIESTITNSDIELISENSDFVKIQELHIGSNIIKNFNNSNTVFSNTNNGYYKFSSTKGIVIPHGTNLNKPLIVEDGQIRWNTDLNYLEVYNENSWQRADGITQNVTEEIFNDLVNIYSIILG